jgi:hypothetical protein
MGAGDFVVSAQGGTDSDRHCFLPDVGMDAPRDVAGMELVHGPLIKSPNHHHLPIHV